MVKEVFGFDVRISREETIKLDWPKKLRSEFLLDPSIKWQLSADTGVWPSYFLRKTKQNVEGPISLEKYIIIEPVEYLHKVLNLWQSEKKMIESFKREFKDEQGVPIAVEINLEKPLLEYEHWNNVFAPEQHTLLEIPPVYHFVGYDVADTGMWSGIANLGYTKEEVQQLAPKWKKRFNQFGLFDNIEHAFEFKEITERRAQEYAPFFVFSLYTKLELLNDFQSGSKR
jgi:hypothetical protein